MAGSQWVKVFFKTVILAVQIHGWAKCYVMVSVCTCTHTKCFTEIKGWVSSWAKEWNQPHNHNSEIAMPLSELKMKVTQARVTRKRPLTCLILPHSVQQCRILASLWIFFLAIVTILLLLPLVVLHHHQRPSPNGNDKMQNFSVQIICPEITFSKTNLIGQINYKKCNGTKVF